MLLSIIIPVYNRENKISRCLNSLSRLKENQIEFLIINDGSTDNTELVCKRYVALDSRFKLITQKNTGVSGARNTGLRNSKGKYISFVDSDDEITEEYENVIKILLKEDRDLFAFDFWVYTEKSIRKQERILLEPGENDKRTLYNNYLSGNSNSACINVYRAELINKYDIHFPSEMSMGEDSVFNANYFKQCQNVYYIKECCYKYFTDDQSSASFAYKLSYLSDFAKIYDNYLSIYCLEDNLNYPVCGKYHINNVFGILKRHRHEMNKTDKYVFRESAFCKNLLLQKYDTWKHELKKWFIRLYLYLF